ncbi:MAG: hypothetical protein HY559_00730 [Gammaproteobacteria bacterium]|nr:hypothetical protein [Gammaproteobacteria bacterium]
MSILKSQLSTTSERFKANAKAMEAQVAHLQVRIKEVKQGGGKKAQEKHTARGKLLSRGLN